MKFYQKLRSRLESKLPEKELNDLPRSYQILGRDLVIKLRPSLTKHKKVIGKAILEILPYLHNVCLIKGISEDIRKPKIEVLAGCKCTQTLHKEHGCKFLLDISKVMWSKGNKSERQRLINSVKPSEVIVDMFAGIGYFSIFLAKHAKAKKIYAIDINPEAVKYLEKNVVMNNVQDRIEILEGDCRKFASALENTADRIIMGYLKSTEKYLPYALKIAKNGCIIHYHNTVKKDKIENHKKMLLNIAKKNGCNIKFLCIKKVKSYAPNVWHNVFDLKVKKR